MTKNVLASLILLLSFSSGIAQNQHKKADQLLKKMVSEKNIVGISAGYAIDGVVKWQNSFGHSNLAEKIPFTETTLTRTASIAKCMTAIAVMQLVEQGLIDLDAPIQHYLPEFPEKKEGDITTRQLLAHTSGIDAYESAKEAESKIDYPNLKEAINVFQDRDLLFKPGTDFFYTTYGYVVLGRIIEAVSQSSFEEYMQKNIWDKAGMENTGVEKFSATYKNKSSLYHFQKKKTKAAKKNNLSNRTPGGGFYTTLNDLIKFGNAVIENKLIKEGAFHLMIEKQFEEKEGNPYGFGWFLYGPKPNENVVIGHGGEQTGAATQLMIIPKSKTVVAVLANTSRTWKEVIGLSAELIRLSEKK